MVLHFICCGKTTPVTVELNSGVSQHRDKTAFVGCFFFCHCIITVMRLLLSLKRECFPALQKFSKFSIKMSLNSIRYLPEVLHSLLLLVLYSVKWRGSCTCDGVGQALWIKVQFWCRRLVFRGMLSESGSLFEAMPLTAARGMSRPDVLKDFLFFLNLFSPGQIACLSFLLSWKCFMRQRRRLSSRWLVSGCLA